jgi:hypothetical protein
MIPVGPISLTINDPVTEVDPAQALGNSSANVQIQNSSAFVLIVLSGGDPYTIQPFFATTIPVTGTPIVITPTQNPQNTSGNTITIVWLLAGEQPPMEDGPLNLPLSTVEQLINAGLNSAVGENTNTVAGATTIVAAIPGSRLILGSLVLQPGVASTITSVNVNVTVGGGSKTLALQYADTTPGPGIAIPYPQGLACDVDTPVIMNLGGTLTEAAFASVTYALSS